VRSRSHDRRAVVVMAHLGARERCSLQRGAAAHRSRIAG
jgi:hypothetical protein